MILAHFRALTRPLHDAMERRLNLLDPNLSHERYFGILRRFHGFYAPLEAGIPAYGDRPADWLDGDRRKAPLLAEDLRSAGMTPESISRLPQCLELPDVSGPLRQLGAMYVLEGATLGGQILLPHVRPLLEGNGGGARFFASYGDRVGAMWLAFHDRLETLDRSELARAVVTTSACLTFESLDRWLFDTA